MGQRAVVVVARLKRLAVVALVVAVGCGPRIYVPPPAPANILPSGPAPDSAVTIEAASDTSCLRPGDRGRIDIATEPGSSLDIVVVFPGSSVDPPELKVPARDMPGGGFVFRFDIPKMAAEGPVVVAMLARKRGQTGSYTLPFDIRLHCPSPSPSVD